MANENYIKFKFQGPYIKFYWNSHDWCSSVRWASPCKVKGLWFNPLSGCVQEATDQYFSPSLFPSLPFSPRINKYFKNQFCWNEATPTCLHIICGCFHTIMAELSSCKRPNGPQSLQYFPYGQVAHLVEASSLT